MNQGHLPDRLPPQSLDAEQAVLGAAMISKTAVAQLLGMLTEEDFYLDAHRRIYEAVRTLRIGSLPVDVLTVPEELRRRGLLDQIGGVAYINALAESVPTAAHQEFYCKTVTEKAGLRRMIDLGNELVQACYDQEALPHEIRQQHLAALLNTKRTDNHQPQRISDLILADFERVCERRAVPVMKFGIPIIDNFAGGLEKGQIAYISGEPGFGKTALAHQIARYACQHWGPVYIFSLEISAEMVGRRMVAAESGFTYQEIRDSKIWVGGRQMDFCQEDLDHLGKASARVSAETAELWADARTYNIDGIVSRAHEWAERYGVRCFVMDYIQLVEVRGRENRTAEVRAVAQAVKNQIAGALDVPVVAISSLTKEGMKRQGGARQADMDGAAALASDATMSVLLTRDPNATWHDLARPIVGRWDKNRNGAMGDLPLTFHAPRYRITARGDDADSPFNEPPPVREEWQNR